MACVLAYKLSDLSIKINPEEIDKEARKLDSKQNNLELNESSCCGEDIKGPKFDYLLSQFWDEAQSKGLFRYEFKNPPGKILDGKYGFLAQLNTDRAEKRRAPQEIQSLRQPFNPSQFNFHKVNPSEIILQLAPWWDKSSSALDLDGKCTDEHGCAIETDHKIIINASPFEYGNILLVPFISANAPQLITLDGLKIAVEMLLLSRSRNFRVGFNSLCAFASVNHCHFHAYYLQHRLYIENVELKQIHGPCYEPINYPAPGFVFLLADLKDFQLFIQSAYKLISFLQDNNLPYNLYLTRGGGTVLKEQQDDAAAAVRLFVWARTPSCGSKACDAFNPALLELAGHLPIKNEQIFQTLTEDYVVEELSRITSHVFENVREEIVKIFP